MYGQIGLAFRHMFHVCVCVCSWKRACILLAVNKHLVIWVHVRECDGTDILLILSAFFLHNINRIRLNYTFYEPTAWEHIQCLLLLYFCSFLLFHLNAQCSLMQLFISRKIFTWISLTVAFSKEPKIISFFPYILFYFRYLIEFVRGNVSENVVSCQMNEFV